MNESIILEDCNTTFIVEEAKIGNPEAVEACLNRLDMFSSHPSKKRPECIIIRSSSGYWSRGATIYEAYKTCPKGGEYQVDMIIGDDSAEVDGDGAIIREAKSTLFRIGTFKSLASVLDR